MSLGNTPTEVQLDPEGGAAAELWQRVLAAEPRPRPIVVSADAAARRTGWAPRAVLALADALAQRLPHVTVVDLELDDPQLHRAAGIRNDEGIADALLFGSSLEHLVQVGPGRHTRIIPAGAYVPSPGEVFASPGWARVIEEATASGGGLLLYVPAETPLGALAHKVDRAILLRGDAAVPAAGAAAGLRQLAVVVPFAPADAPADAAEAAERAAMIADLRARQAAGLNAAGRPHDGGRARQEEPPPVIPVVEREAPAPVVSRRTPIFWTVVALITLSAVYGLWHYVGRDYLERRRQAEDALIAPPQSQSPPAPAGVPLPFSVAIEAHQQLPMAAERVDALNETLPAVGFYVAPILVDTEIYYRVMAGPLRDSATAAAVMDTLIAHREKTGSSAYDIRSTPLTFLLGEFATREQAEARGDELRPLGIPSYTVELPYSAGPPTYRLYSGAYSGPAEADVMRQLLQSTGLADSLVLRTGRSDT
jgi:cell division septation protein DedD